MSMNYLPFEGLVVCFTSVTSHAATVTLLSLVADLEAIHLCYLKFAIFAHDLFLLSGCLAHKLYFLKSISLVYSF